MLKESKQKKKKSWSEFVRQSDEIEKHNSGKSLVAKTHYMIVLHKEKLDIKTTKNIKCWYSARKIVALSKMAFGCNL